MVSGLITSALGYLFQILVGRFFLPSEFALFTATVGLSVFLGSLFGALGMLITRRVAALKTQFADGLPHTYFWRVYAYIAIGGIALSGVTAFFVPYAQEILRTDSVALIWLIFIYVVMAMFYSVNYAIFQGLQKFYSMAVISNVSVLLKVILCIGLIYFGYGVIGAISGMIIALAMIVFLGFWRLSRNLCVTQHLNKPVLPSIEFAPFFAVYLSGIAIAALTQLDIVLVNWYFPGEIAGEYAAIAVLGKAVLYLPGGLALAMFPMVAENHAKAIDSKKILFQAVFATFILSVVVVVIFVIAGKPLLGVLYGNRYLEASSLLPLYGLSMAPLALVSLLEHYLIAKGKVLFAWLFFIMVPLELLAIHYFHSDLRSIILIIGFFSFVLVTFGFIILLITLRDKNRNE
jgi:O-antigen/teichoic acid export membrane protein